MSTTTEATSGISFTPWCNPYKDDVMFTVYCGIIIVWIANLLLGFLGIYNLLRDKQSHISFKICYTLINLAFMISPPLYIFAIQSGWECWYDNFLSWQSLYVAPLDFYLYGLAILYLFFILRLYYSFKGTALRLNKSVFLIMIFGLFVQLSTPPILSYYFLCCGWDPVARYHALSWFNGNTYTNIICSALVMFIFVRKILQTSIAVTTVKAGIDVTEQDIEAAMKQKQIDQEMLSLIIKYMILASIALMSTNLVSIYGLIKSAIPEWRVSLEMRGIHLFLQTLDQMINLICLYLQFPFGKKVYIKLFGGIQSCLQSCFIKCLNLKVNGKPQSDDVDKLSLPGIVLTPSSSNGVPSRSTNTNTNQDTEKTTSAI